MSNDEIDPAIPKAPENEQMEPAEDREQEIDPAIPREPKSEQPPEHESEN